MKTWDNTYAAQKTSPTEFEPKNNLGSKISNKKKMPSHLPVIVNLQSPMSHFGDAVKHK